jgi:adenylate kinase family enzyme
MFFENLNNDSFNCIAKRFVILGPPGSQAHDISLRMIEQLSNKFECINVGDQLVFEMNKRLESGKRISEAFGHHSYVDDEIVIELLKTIITEHE